ncbi:L,D-transpeptidase family protein [Sphingomonas sp. SUN039]|uniref:L,D-transpeptidase family protein n=1 Tax=Sphingomonas sp. SUN039 TaxID=2937787 RepID=UPI002164B921|nr:L,D-transpeptidase family protein [Sphingomonas sp. SUN039]UVO53156.1 L,D-transpeptidase family protein [Sphingomonas sp. SUN039]
MKHFLLAGALLPLVAFAAPTAAPVKPDMKILQLQVVLAKLGFSPGVLDGKSGESLNDAVRGFQESRGLAKSGKLDTATQQALAPYASIEPTKRLTLTDVSLRGPFTSPFPKEEADKSKLASLDYRNALEALAERFHTTNATLIALNGGDTRLAPGVEVVFPNALPSSRDYDTKDNVWRARLNALNVSAAQPEAAKIVVDKSDRVLRVYDKGGKLVAQFPATMGSKTDPLPIGRWTIRGISYNPDWQYNPAILKRADKSDPKMRIPPGPNNPVGVMWIDLSKPHYGIHGTPDPDKIGRAESNGCIRLTNWDAARLSLMVKAGVPAIFQP